MKSLVKNFVIVILIFLIISGIFALFSHPFESTKEISFTQLVKDVNQGKVKKIIAQGNELEIIYQDNSKAKSRKETESVLLPETLISYGANKDSLSKIEFENKPPEKGGTWSWLGPMLVFGILPLVLFGLFFWMIFKQAKGGAQQAFDFTRARVHLFGKGGANLKEKVSFKDVGGLKEAKEELQEVIDFLKYPKKYIQMGARIPRGVLLIGAPGTGKTLLARAIASQANVPFFSVSGSEFIELFVGVGSSRVRSLFAQARKAGRAIIFIDEIDSIGKIRGLGVTGGHEEREQTLNQLLSEMDGIGREENIIVMGATNKPEQLDPALLRPGRFDRRIVLDLPDVNDREEILKIHCRGKPLALDVNLREIAERTPGFSGADLANLVNEAAILAAKRNKRQLYQEELLESIEKVLLGPERKSHLLSAREKKISAYHEGGHALVSSFISEAEEVRKVSIVSRGLAGGYTLSLPKEESRIKTKSEFLAEIAVLLGGYTAERLEFKEISTGAANDLKRASDLARKLVTQYGMSKLGPITFGEIESLTFLGREEEIRRNYSEKVAFEIDKEVSRIIKTAQSRAKKILVEHKKLLDKIAQVLIKKETIEKEEFDALIGRKKTKGKIKVKKVKSSSPSLVKKKVKLKKKREERESSPKLKIRRI